MTKDTKREAKDVFAVYCPAKAVMAKVGQNEGKDDKE